MSARMSWGAAVVLVVVASPLAGVALAYITARLMEMMP
jgi:hypothetical protein